MIGQKTRFLVILFSLTILLAGSLQNVSAENLDTLSKYSIKLSLSPSLVEGGSITHPVGYVYLENARGVPITSDKDLSINLMSDDPSIASVPNEIILLSDSEFAKFDIFSGVNGDTVISASLNDKTDFKHIQVGTSSTILPDDLTLELNIPTNQMHVFSEMPFSVYLKTSDGNVVRAPYDITVDLEYEESLSVPSSDQLVIKTGDYYAWGTIMTNEKIGNTYRIVCMRLLLCSKNEIKGRGLRFY